MALPTIIEFAYVAAGGAIGSMCRYGVQHLEWFDDSKFCYTAIANLTGCFIIGVLSALLQHFNADRCWSLLLVTGLLGGYTTFSSFSLDAVTLMAGGMTWRAVGYVLTTVLGGLGSCALGLFITTNLLKQ